MSAASIAVCPPLPGGALSYDPADVADVLLDSPSVDRLRVISPFVPAPDPQDDERTQRAHWVAHLAIALATSGIPAPVLLVVGGTSGSMTAALGFSQRAARRSVAGYVLIDAAVPGADDRTADWPDAPVVYLASPAAPPDAVQQARLRGWDVVDVADASAPELARAVGEVSLR